MFNLAPLLYIIIWAAVSPFVVGLGDGDLNKGTNPLCGLLHAIIKQPKK